ncbi:hypothetical protein CBL_07262 [Carabus blaptoides fortunei]
MLPCRTTSCHHFTALVVIPCAFIPSPLSCVLAQPPVRAQLYPFTRTKLLARIVNVIAYYRTPYDNVERPASPTLTLMEFVGIHLIVRNCPTVSVIIKRAGRDQYGGGGASPASGSTHQVRIQLSKQKQKMLKYVREKCKTIQTQFSGQVKKRGLLLVCSAVIATFANLIQEKNSDLNPDPSPRRQDRARGMRRCERN